MPSTYEPIATTSLSASTSTITFSSIPSTYTDLKFILVGKGATATNVNLRFNGDTGGNYFAAYLQGNGSAASANYQSSIDNIYLTQAINWSDTYPSFLEADIFSYAGSLQKTITASTSGDYNGSGFATKWVGRWASTSAITSLSITAPSNWAVGTTATLYGIKAA